MAFTLLDLEKIIAQLRRRLRLLELQGANGTVRAGLAANRPNGSDLSLSTGVTVMYYATDTKTLSIWNPQTETWNTTVFS